MNVTLSDEQKKSLAITTVLFGLLLLLLFLIKFATEERIQELAGGGGGGVTVNFGDSEFGSGADYTSEVLKVTQTTKSAPQPTASSQEDILTQDSDEDAVSVTETKKPIKSEVKKPTITQVEVKKPSKSTNDALSSILGGSNKGGDGDDGVSGNKGKLNGDKNSNNYYGDGGSGGGTGGGNGPGNGPGSGPGSGGGSGGGYSLGNRKALSKPAPNSDCSNETGIVVVEVSVDKNGNTISATAGIKGTTITAKCLRDQAKQAAMRTKWQASDNAPDRQVGKIIYNFGLN